MHPEAHRLFHELVALPPAEREQFLTQVQVSAEVRAEVESLLLYDRPETGTLGGSVAQIARDLLVNVTGSQNMACGAYTLLTPIGDGGMGAVWLAERSDGRFQRKVALKFLKIALAGRGGEERFKREGMILGRLAHAHIAQLLDAGVSPGGQPFLVLEHVDGRHIDQDCDERKRSVDLRISLFLQVLDAVAHAHANLIVHRDIKPSNLLVNTEGQVKLLDFGVAKLLAGEGQGIGALTREGGGAMTLLYAAPEQVTGADVTTATDVYALGVMLFVLLAGRHPFDVGARTEAELINNILNTEPPLLSDAVNASKTCDSIAALRATTPDKLWRRLHGDLDKIVAKALKKNPQERYRSVSEMAADLRRHLNHEPISARADTVPYRIAKFVRRNRTAVILASLAAVAAIVGTVGTAVQARTANRERLTAERRFTQVRQLANKVLGLDRQLQTLPGSTKVRHEIVAMSKDYLQALAAEAAGDQNLAMEIGLAFMALARVQGLPQTPNLGQYAEAEQSLLKAESLLDPVIRTSPQNQEARLAIARIVTDRAILAHADHRRSEARALAGRAAQRLDAALAVDKATLSDSQVTLVLTILSNIAVIYKNVHDFENAIVYGRRQVEIARARALSSYVATGLSVVADSMRLSGDLDGALNSIREARRTVEQAPSSNAHRHRVALQGVLWREGIILGEYGEINLDRPLEAGVVLQQAFDIIEEWARTDPSDASGRMLFTPGGGALGNVLRDREPARALAVYDRSLLRLSEVRNNNKARRGEAELLAYASYPLRRLNRPAEALDRIEKALKILSEVKDYPNPVVVLGSEIDIALRALADHHAATGQPQRAAEIYQDLHDKILASKPDPEHDLRHAVHLSRLYEVAATVNHKSRRTRQAESMSALRLNLWRGWQTKLPQNAFVSRQLAAAQP